VPDLLLETIVDASPDDCFMLSLSVDAHASSMGSSGERVVAGVRSGAMELGQTVTWQARHFGFPFRMTSQITAYSDRRASLTSRGVARSRSSDAATRWGGALLAPTERSLRWLAQHIRLDGKSCISPVVVPPADRRQSARRRTNWA
jgi:hypothetical protein